MASNIRNVEELETEVVECTAPEIEEKVEEKTWIRKTTENIVEFVEDHAEGILLTAVTAPMVIMFGQTIRYMHLLNKAAKKGNFFYRP